ncbi:MAG: TIGR04282 family arsenosugar biosynthesis glycosyltransferase [Gammaproteobacteria bacterium]|nr:TIGR04282 family arsenosugar biosynthesis glycosyltransferase [Gammaproteobacteria bacterium]MDH3561608.1 TIGR04282 family arsenosugar biosynthesis glycosyltransferase [Gammaproteobacteria bacterium]
MRFPDARIQVFARSPEPGQTKTRLIPLLGETGAAAFHARLVNDRLSMLTTAGLCPVELWCSPSSSTTFFQDCRERYDVSLHDQCAGDLGMRMHHALASALEHTEAALLVGTDCPSLGAADIDEAFTRLQQGIDVVLGPAHDGGYYLVGMQQPAPALFSGIPWGSSTVFAESVGRLEQLGLSHHCLAERMDVDTPDDYRRLDSREDGMPTGKNVVFPL